MSLILESHYRDSYEVDNDSRSESITIKTIESIVQKRLNVSNIRLHNDLIVLSALISFPVTTTTIVDYQRLYIESEINQTVQHVKNQVFRFIRQEILNSTFSINKTNNKKGDNDNFVSVVCGAIELWTMFVRADEQVKQAVEATMNKVENNPPSGD